MNAEEQLARVRELWRQLRPWIDDAADQAFGSDDQWALRVVLELDDLLDKDAPPDDAD